ncbi:hypothetical protein LQR31_21020 [Chromobacterium vaccinii]|uniref:hypothetical protein n=1 Tax=Chromobacterium vaccinii TaxID=1108595 RepID=UPI001E329FFD|nr:hypothetical protein [Chromobacterium vaccinii]MCD4486958.1 hypothetical protein [Chromobacterium vaccinii]
MKASHQLALLTGIPSMKIQDNLQQQARDLENAMPYIQQHFNTMKELLLDILSQPFAKIEYVDAYLQTSTGPHVRIIAITKGIQLGVVKALATKRNLSMHYSTTTGDIHIHSEPWAVLVICCNMLSLPCNLLDAL